MNKYDKEFNRFKKKYKDIYGKDMMTYLSSFIKKIKESLIMQEYLDVNSICTYSLLLELSKLSKYKKDILGSYTLSIKEIEQAFGRVILNKDITKLLLEDNIFMYGTNLLKDEVIYHVTDYAKDFFKLKYNLEVEDKFSMSDILLLTTDDLQDYID